MAEPEEFYTPTHVDEQIDALFQGRAMPGRDIRLADDLHAILEHEHENVRSLQQVWQRLLGESSEQPITKIIALSERQQQGETVMIQNGTYTQKKSQARSLLRVWSTLAAVLVVIILVGSMLLILNGVRQQGNSSSTAGKSAHTPVMATPTPVLREGQIVYQSANFDLTMPASWSPDGKRLAVAVNRTTVESWDALTGKHLVHYPVAQNSDAPGALTVNYVTNVAWSPDGSKLLVAESHTIYLFEADTARLLHTFTVSTQAMNASTFSPLVAASASAQRVPLSNRLPLSGSDIFGNAVWSPNGQYIATVYNGAWHSNQSEIFIWDARSGSMVKSLNGFSANLLSVKWSHQENRLAALGYDPTVAVVKVWDTGTWDMVKEYKNITDFDWSPDGTQLALASAASDGSPGNSVHIVSLASGQSVLTLSTSAETLSWSPDGTRLAVDGGSGPITIWSASSGTLLYTFSQKGTYKEAWSPDSKYLSCAQVVRTGSGKTINYSEQILIWVA